MAKPILRDPKTGQLLPGSGALNPAGRPLKKRDILDKIMKRFYGPNCEQLLLNMIDIAEYDPKVDFKNTPSAEKRFFKPRFTNMQIADARKFLFEHFYGKPIAESKTEITTPESQSIEINFIKGDESVKKDEDEC
jgi:hypothetical protein